MFIIICSTTVDYSERFELHQEVSVQLVSLHKSLEAARCELTKLLERGTVVDSSAWGDVNDAEEVTSISREDGSVETYGIVNLETLAWDNPVIFSATVSYIE